MVVSSLMNAAGLSPEMRHASPGFLSTATNAGLRSLGSGLLVKLGPTALTEELALSVWSSAWEGHRCASPRLPGPDNG